MSRTMSRTMNERHDDGAPATSGTPAQVTTGPPAQVTTGPPAQVTTPVRPTALTRGRRGVLLPMGVAAVTLIGAGYVANVDPNAAGHYPTCPFLAITGWYCPGCGALRALHALAQGDLLTALARNPLTVVAVGYLGLTWVFWLQRSARGRPLRWLAPPWVLYGVLAAILLFWVMRNVPGWIWLSPA